MTVAMNISNANGVTNYATKIAEIVGDTNQHRLRGDGSSFAGCYTGRNEPNSGYSVAEALAFNAAVKDGDATAISGGPGHVSLNEAYQDNYFSLIDGGMFDTDGHEANEYHDYNMCNGDIATLLTLLRSLKAGLDDRDITLPIFMTEGGMETSWYPGMLLLRDRAGAGYILNTVARELILAVPYEHQFYYYDRRAGFDSVLTWLSSDGGPLPGWAMHRAFAREVYGKTVATNFSFGDHYDNLCVGGIWEATDGSGVAAVIGVTGLPDVTFYATGSPGTLTGVDCFGNTSTITLTNNTFTLTPTDEIQYVRLPSA
jgi:hypothetical protein